MIETTIKEICDLIWMARRYADNRSTYAPSLFNEIYKSIVERNPELLEKEKVDPDRTICQYFPWARDGMHNPETGTFDAIPK